jgi:hypothetical protein
MGRRLLAYEVPDDALIFLIAASVSGPPERQLAAKLLLDCLRQFHTSGEIERCLNEVARISVLDVVPEAKRLASLVGILGEKTP